MVDLENLPLVWKVHPFKEHWVKSVALVLFLIIVIGIVQSSFKEPFLTGVSFVVLISSLLRYFFPTEYRINNDGIQITFLGRTTLRKWSEFKSYYICKTGVQLSPFSRPHWLDTFRGHFVLLGKDKEVIIEYIKARVQNADFTSD
ncbi:MAG: hypothetical protein N3A72_04370 [bacterium]|nr:hypothetical protein [bacterium]